MVIPTWEIRQGDVMERLREMPDESVHCVVTSPPYFGLRDYGTAQWEGGNANCQHKGKYERTGGYGSPKQSTNQGANFVASGDCTCGAIRIDSQLGLESTPEAYVAKMVAVFREVRRVLRSDGTCWVNLGDSYAGSGCGWGGGSISELGNQHAHVHGDGNLRRSKDQTPPPGMKAKDLVGIPWMVAFALRADGWYLRSDIIWSKPNPMPESVTDRPTKSHEYVFLLSKSAKYYYDAQAIAEPNQNIVRPNFDGTHGLLPKGSYQGVDRCGNGDSQTRNARSVWNIATQPFSEAHFATFPERLVDRCISAGTSEKGVCGECGKPWVRIVEINDPEQRLGKSYHDHQNDLVVGQRAVPPANGAPAKVTTGWRGQCDHAALPVPATVLDIFSGSGTSGVVAHRLGRNYIGIELNPQYVAMSERRLGGTIYQASLF